MRRRDISSVELITIESTRYASANIEGIKRDLRPKRFLSDFDNEVYGTFIHL